MRCAMNSIPDHGVDVGMPSACLLTDSEETMSLFEWGEQTSCSDCGAEIWPDVDQAFSCSARTYLCFACAERRGAVYDARGDRWLVAPRITGLPQERRPQA